MREGDADGAPPNAHRNKRRQQPLEQPPVQKQQHEKQQPNGRQQQDQQGLALNADMRDSLHGEAALWPSPSCPGISSQSSMPSGAAAASDTVAAASAAAGVSSNSNSPSRSTASREALQLLPLFCEDCGQQEPVPSTVQAAASHEEDDDAEEVAAAATSSAAADSTALCVSTDLRGVVGGLVNWFGGGWVADRFSVLMRDSLQSMMMLLLRLQRQQLLRRFCPDLMERYTHALSEGRLRAERHSVRTGDGYEIHFYRLRRVTRCCCIDSCGCEVLRGTAASAATGGAAATPTPATFAAFPASRSATNELCDSGPPPAMAGSSSSHSSSLDGDCRGQVFVFVHGLLESSLNWITGGFLSLPFIVAERGGEVWLVNSRGNEYTRKLSTPSQQQLQKQQQQQDTSDRPPVELQADDNRPAYSLATLHAFIEEQQQNFLTARAQQQALRRHDEQQHRQQQQQQYNMEGECCSLVCCHCSGLTSFPSIRGKPQEQQKQLLKNACMQASALLLNMHLGGQNPEGFVTVNHQQEQQQRPKQPRQQQQQQFERVLSESELSTALSSAGRAFAESDASVHTPPQPTAAAVTEGTAATPAATPAAVVGCVSRCLSNDSMLHALCNCGTVGDICSCGGACACTAMDSHEEDVQPVVGAAAAPGNCGAGRQHHTDAAASACGNASVPRRDLRRSVCGCGAQECTSSNSNNNTNRRWLPRICRGFSSSCPPFVFSDDLASGLWSFQDMAFFDLPAQLQYIVQHSQTLARRREAMLAAPPGGRSSSGGNAFGCGVVAVGQSQGAAQLLIALSSSPSLGLLLQRSVLFSPPLILQPLQQLPYSARVLLLLGMQHPTLLLQALKLFVRFIPKRLLSTAGNAIVGSGRRGGMRFYNTPLQQQQLFLNFAHTPSGKPANPAVAAVAADAAEAVGAVIAILP